MRARWWIVLASVALLSACGEGSASTAEVAAGAAWEIGDSVGTVYGPFPDAFDVAQAPSTDVREWLTVVVPSGGPLDGFFDVVDDAVERGFTATARDGGACRLEWQREEVPFGENGEGDGEDFGGTARLEDDLPAGAEVVGVDCRAVVERAGADAVEIWLRASIGNKRFPRPGDAAVVIRTRRDAPPTNEFTRQDVDLDLPPVDDPGGTPTFYVEPREGHTWGAEGGCLATVERSPEGAATAVSAAIEAGQYAASFKGSPIEVTTAGRASAVQSQMVPAGGPVVYVVATETDTGSDVLVCLNSTP